MEKLSSNHSAKKVVSFFLRFPPILHAHELKYSLYIRSRT
jgi:hypothetical protein